MSLRIVDLKWPISTGIDSAKKAPDGGLFIQGSSG